MKYRAEIDGIRALAVIPVILFHAGFEIFSGGFVGVDIFFVISGYLITSILIEDIEKHRFSLVSFYERRARRILPALFLVMLVCIPFAWLWMLPLQMKEFSQSLIAVSFFVSNILFWRESGYFAAAAEEKPLLHTWSLSVEEQYYIFFPLFILFTWRFGRSRLFWVICILALFSLCLSEWGWRNQASANFYLAPTRAWELFAGSLTAFIINKHGFKSSNILSAAGFFAVLFSLFYYDKSTPFPSVYTLLPIMGVVLLILYAGSETIAAKILSKKIFVSMGLLSYSAYLWHQPIFAFARIKSFEKPSMLLMAFLIMATVLMAWFSWRYIETPFRNKAKFSRFFIFAFTLTGIFFFSSFGYIGVTKDGFNVERFADEDRRFLNTLLVDNSSYVTQRFNDLKGRQWDDSDDTLNVFLIGDSYAQDLVNAVFESPLSEKISLKVHHISGKCGNLFVPFDRKQRYISLKDQLQCFRSDLLNDNDLLLALTKADEVWLASSWKEWQLEFLDESLDYFDRKFGKPLIVFGKKDFPKYKPIAYVGFGQHKRKNLVLPLQEHQIELNKKMKYIVGVERYIDTQSLVCGNFAENCKIFDMDGMLKTYDGDHLTRSGATYFGSQLYKVIGKRL